MAQEQTKQGPAKEEKQTKKTDDMLNLFSAQVVEDDSLGRFAKSLKDVNAKDLLWDAIDIRERLKGKVR